MLVTVLVHERVEEPGQSPGFCLDNILLSLSRIPGLWMWWAEAGIVPPEGSDHFCLQASLPKGNKIKHCGTRGLRAPRCQWTGFLEERDPNLRHV